MAVLTVEEVPARRVRRGRTVSETERAEGFEQDREWLSALRVELDDYCVRLGQFAGADPADVLAIISSIHARLSHLRVQLYRNGSQRAKSVRTQEIDPLIEALEFQFKCASRIISLSEQEWRMAGGQS